MYNAYDFSEKKRPVTGIAKYNSFENSTPKNNQSLVIAPKSYNNTQNATDNSLTKGMSAIGSSVGKYLANSGSSSGSNSAIMNGLTDYFGGSGSSTGSGSAISSGLNKYFSNGSGGSGFGSGGGNFGWIGLAQGADRGLGTLFNGGSLDESGQSMFNINEDDSDFMQALNGTLSGAQMGSGFGPWGAVIGGVAGLGTSFLDDI